MRDTHDTLIDALLRERAVEPPPFDDDALLAALAAPGSPDPEEIVAFVLGELSAADAARVRDAIRDDPFWLREYQDACFLLDVAPEAAAQTDPFAALAARLTGWVRSLAPAPLPALTATLADAPDRGEVRLAFPDGVRGALIPDGESWRLVLESELWPVGTTLALTLDTPDGSHLGHGLCVVIDGLLGGEASHIFPAIALAGVDTVTVGIAPVPADVR